MVGAGLGVRAVTREGSEGRPKGTVPAPSPFLLSVSPGAAQDEPMSDSFTRHPPDSMLRPPSRFIDSFASVKTLPAASGRLCRRGRADDVAVPVFARSCFGSIGLPRQQRRCSLIADPSGTGFPLALSASSARNEQGRGTEPVRSGNDGSRHRRFRFPFVIPFRSAFPFFPIFLPVWPTAECRERDAVLFCLGQSGTCCRFRPLFIASFGTVFPSSSSHTTPAVTGDEPGRGTVLFMFRKCGLRVDGSHCNSGKCAALAGFREGGRAGKPVPRLSPCINILRSDRYDGVARGYIQFKDRPPDRRHAYF